MKAVVKGIYSTDLDLATYRPIDPFDDGQWVRLMIGPEGNDGEESFDVLVCTPRWLVREISRDKMQLVRHTLLMEKFDLARALERLHHEVESASGESWQKLLLSLVQIGRWEFDNYRA